MFKTTTSVLVGVLAIAAGVLTIIFRDAITGAGVVTCGGILFMAAAILNAVITYFAKDDKGRRRASTVTFLLNMIASAAALGFGICMIVRPDIFVKFVPLVFSILVLFGALMLFYYISYGNRGKAPLPHWLVAYPLLVLVGAIVIFCLEGEKQDALIMLYTGISLIIYGLGMISMVVESARSARAAVAAVAGHKKEAAVDKANPADAAAGDSAGPHGLE